MATPPPHGLGVVVVSHQSAADLPSCLEALGAARGVDRVVVVDNASSDGSAAIAAAAGDDRVTVTALAENTGFAGGCNRGFASLRDARWVATCNPDVLVGPDTLARCAAALAADDRLGAVAPRLMRPDGVTVDSVGQRLSRVHLEVRDRGYGARLTTSHHRPTRVLAPCGALGVFRRRALAEVAAAYGPWEERFFCFWEDLELGWRLNRAGWHVRTVPDAVATHTRGAGARPGRGPLRWRRGPELEACVLTNRWMTLIRHAHPSDLVVRAPVLAAWDGAATALGILHRPRLLGHLVRRWSLVREEWRRRQPGPRLADLI